ncbi:MAG: MlaD family protein [Pseudomonadota bacterium]
MQGSNEIPTASVETKSARRDSLVWLVPLFAAIVGGAVAWQTYSSQGPLVEIVFDEAPGMEAGKTQIRHKNIVVGMVEDVSLTDDFDQIKVTARINRDVAHFLGETTEFWVVSARIDGTRISGLSTLLSGSFIEMNWSGKPENRRRKFAGLERPPLTPPGTPGRRLTLKAETAGSLNVGSPVYFRQLKVGRIESRQLSEDARSVIFSAFIDAPYHEHLTSAVRFWNVSGIEVSAGSEGLKLHIESAEALLAGGVAFGTIDHDLARSISTDNEQFNIFSDRKTAEESIFQDDDDDQYRFIAEFEESVGGLKADAPIEWDGIRIGKVLDVVYEPDLESGTNDRHYAILQFQPARLGLSDVSADDVRGGIATWVQRGMRVQLASGNILTGAKKIQLTLKADVEAAVVDFDAKPYPSLPTVPSDLQAVAQNAEQLVKNLSELPLNELVVSATQLLKDADRFVSDPQLSEVPGELSTSLKAFAQLAKSLDTASADFPKLLKNLNALTGRADTVLQGVSPDSEIYVELSSAVRDLKSAAHSIAELAQRLETSPNSLIFGR